MAYSRLSRGKRDANEGTIVAALEAAGARVLRVSGKGLPDVFVRYQGRWTPLEVKSRTGTKTAAQREIDWAVVRTVEQAFGEIGVRG